MDTTPTAATGLVFLWVGLEQLKKKKKEEEVFPKFLSNGEEGLFSCLFLDRKWRFSLGVLAVHTCFKVLEYWLTQVLEDNSKKKKKKERKELHGHSQHSVIVYFPAQ